MTERDISGTLRGEGTMDIGKIIREVEIVREVDPEPFPFDPAPAREPVPSRTPDEATPARNRVP